MFHANENQKQSGVVILISDKIDFKIKTVIKAKEGHYTEKVMDKLHPNDTLESIRKSEPFSDVCGSFLDELLRGKLFG